MGYSFLQPHVLWGTQIDEGNRPILRTRLKTNYLMEGLFQIHTRNEQEFIMETTDESSLKTITAKMKSKN